MSCLLHCVFRGSGPPPPECRECGEAIRIIADNALGAAVSDIAEGDRLPGLSRLLGYERTIAAFHSSRTVVPLRFGCVVASDCSVLRLLQEHRQEYESLLDRLGGRTEMGVRVLCPPRPERLDQGAGTAYVAALRRRHGSQIPLAAEEEEIVATVCRTVAELGAEVRRETSALRRGRLISLQFLVEKHWAASFRERMLGVRDLKGAKLLVSGPWPPYSFV
jgi:Gas vesicle synthesis protein GvpL/GvpF